MASATDRVLRARPDLIALDVTGGCNLRCLHCYNASGSAARDMTDGELELVARQIGFLRPFNLCLCGGEPLTRGNLLKVIDILYPAVGRIAMVTNGILMTREKAEEIVRHGVYTVQISLDGAEAWQHDTIRGRQGAFDAALAALDRLREAGLPQRTVSVLPTKLVLHELEKYVALCLAHGVHIIRSMPFLPSGRGRTADKLMLSADEYFSYKRDFFRLREQYMGQIVLDWEDPLGLILSMPDKARRGIPSYSVEIRCNGDIVPSNYLPVVCGNLLRYPLAAYWEGGYRLIWRDGRLLSYTSQIRQIYDLDTAEPRPYGDEQIVFDILEDQL